MTYISFLSLEQDLSLKLKSDAINQISNPETLQNEIFDLFEQTLKLDQEMHKLLFKNKSNQLHFLQEIHDKLSVYKETILLNNNTEELQEILIEAHKKYLAKDNFAQVVRQENLIEH